MTTERSKIDPPKADPKGEPGGANQMRLRAFAGATGEWRVTCARDALAGRPTGNNPAGRVRGGGAGMVSGFCADLWLLERDLHVEGFGAVG